MAYRHFGSAVTTNTFPGQSRLARAATSGSTSELVSNVCALLRQQHSAALRTRHDGSNGDPTVARARAPAPPKAQPTRVERAPGAFPDVWLEAFVDALLSSEPVPPKFALSNDLRDRLIAPAARLLGQRWSDDTATLAEVALASDRMIRLLESHPERPVDGTRGSVVLAAPTGEAHTLPLFLLADRLRESGWRVRHSLAGTADEVQSARARLGSGPVLLSVFSAVAASNVQSLAKAIKRSGTTGPVVAAGPALDPCSRYEGVDAVVEGDPFNWLESWLQKLGCEASTPH